jgi:hypothetical protein
MRIVACVGIAALLACEDKEGGGPGGSSSTKDIAIETTATSTGDADVDVDMDADLDTDTDTDTHATDPQDTTVPLDTGDTGGPIATQGGRALGCYPEWVITPVDTVDCSYEIDQYNGLVAGPAVITTTGAFDSAGQLVLREVDNTYTGIHDISTWSYDPVTGDFATATYDGDADGTVDTTSVYTWTYDANGLPTEQRIDTTEVATGTVTTAITSLVQGPCGTELLSYDYDGDSAVDATTSITRFTDGDERLVDDDNDGIPEVRVEYFVDPLTGDPISYKEEKDPGHNGYELQLYYTSLDPVNGWLLEQQGVIWLGPYGAPVDGDIGRTLTYDAEGRQTYLDVVISVFGVPQQEDELFSTWTCPP